MSNTRENILSALRKNVRETYDMPNLGQLKPITYGDPVAEFKTKTTTTAGARLIEARVGDDLNALVRQAYPDAQLIASNLQGVNAQLNPDNCSVEELERVDVGVIEGKIGVAENACIWVPQQMKEKTVCFASQQLVIVLRQRDVVNNMHEAYDRIASSSEYFQQYQFGTFLSGPSKTADIESALVYGAQAARGVTVVLLSD